MSGDLVAALRARGLVHQVTDEALGPLSAREAITGYIGFDPSADSLHAGSLYQAMLLVHLARSGHRPIAVMGGGTGMIGDPTGKESERPLLSPEEIRSNVAKIRSQIQAIFTNAGVQVEFADNAEWLGEVRLVEFLRDIGKHFTVNWMMAKDSVRTRLEDRDQGISYTEFSYMLLQAFDFLRLHQTRGCRLQMGGSDQWGNITAGVELIRRRAGGEAFGLTSPLLLTPDGKKFGKSAGNAVWLDPARTSPDAFFQFWINLDDIQASALLAPYTFLPMPEVEALRAEARAAPEKRVAQRRLAFEVTSFVHGRAEAERCRVAAESRFGEKDLLSLPAADLEAALGGAPRVDIPRNVFGARASAYFVHKGIALAKSGADFRRLVAQGAISVNEKRVTDPNLEVALADLHLGRYLVLRRGKKDYALVRVTDG